jgi:hypothetical protein
MNINFAKIIILLQGLVRFFAFLLFIFCFLLFFFCWISLSILFLLGNSMAQPIPQPIRLFQKIIVQSNRALLHLKLVFVFACVSPFEEC